MNGPDHEPSSSVSQIGRFGGYGITLGLAVALFAWLGLKLDERLGTSPLFVLSGTFLAFGAGFYRMYRDLTADPDVDGDEDDPTDR